MTAASPGRSRLRRGAVAALAIALSLGLAELGSRGLMRVLGRPYDGARTRVLAGTWLNAVSGALPLEGDSLVDRQAPDSHATELHPYFGWQLVDSDRIVDAAIESFRSEESEASFDVVILGGSVAAMFGGRGSERLAELVARDPRLAGRSVRIHDLARAAYKQPQLHFLLGYLLALGVRPDAVVEIDGFNESAMTHENVLCDTHPVFPAAPSWRSVALARALDPELLERFAEARAAREAVRDLAERFLASGAWKSCVLGEAGIWRLQVLRHRATAAQVALVEELGRTAERARLPSGPKLPPDEVALLATAVRIWEESSASMAMLCEGRGIPYLHVLQPTLHDAGSKPLTSEELATSAAPPGWAEGAKSVYPLLRVAGARLAARGIAFHDASRAFADVREGLYYDSCHFGARGNELLAESIAPALLVELGRAGERRPAAAKPAAPASRDRPAGPDPASRGGD